MDGEFLSPKEFLEKLMGANQKEYEAVGPLPEELDKDFQTIMKERADLVNKERELNARRELLWVKIEREVGILDRSLEYRDGVIYAEKEGHRERRP